MSIILEKFNLEKHNPTKVATLIYSADEETKLMVFGEKEKGIQYIEKLMRMENNYFNPQYIYCAIKEGNVVGVIGGYGVDKKSDIDKDSGKDFIKVFGIWPFLKRLPTIMKMNKMMSKDMDEDGYYIHVLCVDEKHRREGFGTEMLKAIEKEHKKLYLHVSINNTKARAFYEKYGFKVQSEDSIIYKGKKVGTCLIKKRKIEN